jgi:hypothetical protein
MSQYYIPKEVHFYLRTELNFSTAQGAKIKVRPAFPVSSRSIARGHKVVQAAQAWASLYSPNSNSPNSIILNNIPKVGYKLIHLDSREEGGRVGKVITPDGFLVDLREDVFSRILFTKGIPADGSLDVELQWCQNGSQIRLELPGYPGFEKYIPEDELK